MTHLQKITTRAKQLRKHHPQTKWTNLVKMAAKELKGGAVSGHKKKSTYTSKKVVHHKKATNMATRRTVVVAGHKKHTTKRRVGATSGQKMKPMNAALMLLGGVVGGSLGAVVYSKVPGGAFIKGGVQAGLGFAGMTTISPGKHPFMFGIANGIGTAGGVNIAHGAGMISGMEDMVSGLFDGLSDNSYDVSKIPESTAGMHNTQEDMGLHQGGYMGFTGEDIDKWIYEGIPAQGGEDWR